MCVGGGGTIETDLEVDRMGFFGDGLSLLETIRSQWLTMNMAMIPQIPAAKYCSCCLFVAVLATVLLEPLQLPPELDELPLVDPHEEDMVI